MKLTKQQLEDFVTESIVSLEKVRAQRQLKAFEFAISPFVKFWDEGFQTLLNSRVQLDGEDEKLLAHFMKEFKTSGTNLSVFLRGIRLKMIKRTK